MGSALSLGVEGVALCRCYIGSFLLMRIFLNSVLLLGFAAALSGCGLFHSSSSKRGSAGASGWDGYAETGDASFYGAKHHGRKTASGEVFDASDLTAAHRRLPFGTRVQVTNLENGKNVVVEVNDRGPFVRGRVIDLSRAAFRQIADLSDGVVRVRVQVVN
jgi:rare lipoprotein A